MALMRPQDPARADPVGVDVGSTTVKVFVGSLPRADARRVRCARHRGRVLDTVASLLRDVLPARVALAVTGSGGALLHRLDPFTVHEVTAAAEAVTQLHPEARTLIDLGGQDARMVTLAVDARGAHVAMNDRCAAGTGVTLDRCLRRLGVTPEAARAVAYDPDAVHPLSARCGVFAESDLVSLARRGIGVEALVSTLADAIVRASLTALARGVTPTPPVVLLGGPHAHLPALLGAWRRHLAALWRARGVAFDLAGRDVFVPVDALHYPAMGASMRCAAAWVRPRPRAKVLRAMRAPPPESETREEPPFTLAPWPESRPTWPTLDAKTRRYVLGIDVGSTGTKAVVLDGARRLIAHWQRPSGDPVTDSRELLSAAEGALARIDHDARFASIAVTGQGAPWFAPLVGADVVRPETVAHARAARAVMPDVDAVCDVGGQGIRVLSLDADGALRDLRSSGPCGAGVGQALEATAREYGVPRDNYAKRAFGALRAPRFDEGCVVFLDAARVGFLREGYRPDEVLAGLARAIPRILWNQVMNGVSASTLGRAVLLQGGVQRNEAAVRAQVDHLAAVAPGVRVAVHPHPELAGALGVALLALDAAPSHDDGAPRSRPLPVVAFRADERLRCGLCEVRCPRAEVELADGDARRVLRVGHACDAGDAPSPAEGARMLRLRDARAPDLCALEARELFAHDPAVRPLRAAPRRVRVGIPRVLAMYRAAPFFRAYLEALGVAPRDVIFSPPTSDALRREGAHRGSTDPCFPVKLILAHAGHLVRHAEARSDALDAVFIPRVTHAAAVVRHAPDSASCPVVAAAPALVRAAFGGDRGVTLLDPELDLSRPERLRAQLFEAFRPLLAMTRGESDGAVAVGVAATRAFEARLQARAMRVLSAPGRGAVLVLARPYHADPGVSHHVGAELRALGYPSFSARALPRDEAWLSALMRDDLRGGAIADPYDVRDLLPECDDADAAERLWAARIAARHGGIGVVDLSSFKCPQDAPTHAPIRALFDHASTAYCALHDLDETCPRDALRVRLGSFVDAMRARGLAPWS